MLQPINTENNHDKWLRLLRFVECLYPGCECACIKHVLPTGIVIGFHPDYYNVKDMVFIHKDVYNNCVGDNWEEEVKIDEELTKDTVMNLFFHEIKQIDIGESVLNCV